jgi:uncharacterized membrane protein
MDLSLPYELPYLHPAVVHLPVAILLAAGGVACGYVAAGTRTWRHVLLGLLLAGAASTWFARSTGGELADAVEGDPQVEALLGTHATAARWTYGTALIGVILAAATTFHVRRRPPSQRDSLWLRLLLAVPPLGAALLVAYTAHVGGLMVWGVPR